MKKILLSLLAVSLLFLAACGNTEVTVDYDNATSFEAALNDGENLEGKIVTIEVDNLETQSMYGYNIWAGEHLNFISEKNPNVKKGDEITVKVTEATSALGSWLIKYEKIK